MRKKTVISLGLLAGLAIAASVYFYKTQNPDYEVVKPERGPAVMAVYATGTVEASVMVPVAPRQTGRLMALFVDEGQHVTKGMVMAQMEDHDLQNVLDDKIATAALAQKEYDRQEKLAKTGAISKQAFDKSLAALESANATVAQAQANLDFLKLIAPEDGTVIQRDGEIGEMIPANQAVLWLSCCSGLRVSAEVDEEDIALVQPGQDVVIRADAYPGEVFDGKVQSITPKGDPVARSYRVRISLPEDTKLMIGMTAETNIIISKQENALLVPLAAVSDKAVQIVRDGKVTRQEISTGAKSEDKVEITKGLSDGDKVLATYSKDLEDGQRVNTFMKDNNHKP